MCKKTQITLAEAIKKLNDKQNEIAQQISYNSNDSSLVTKLRKAQVKLSEAIGKLEALETVRKNSGGEIILKDSDKIVNLLNEDIFKENNANEIVENASDIYDACVILLNACVILFEERAPELVRNKRIKEYYEKSEKKSRKTRKKSNGNGKTDKYIDGETSQWIATILQAIAVLISLIVAFLIGVGKIAPEFGVSGELDSLYYIIGGATQLVVIGVAIVVRILNYRYKKKQYQNEECSFSELILDKYGEDSFKTKFLLGSFAAPIPHSINIGEVVIVKESKSEINGDGNAATNGDNSPATSQRGPGNIVITHNDVGPGATQQFNNTYTYNNCVIDEEKIDEDEAKRISQESRDKTFRYIYGEDK